MFSTAELHRYARQLALPAFGPDAQARLRDSSVLVVGCGGLGSPALAYLAAAGIGRLGFVDGDIVDITNLQRQILHATPDVGRLKTRSAEARLRALNPHVALEPHNVLLAEENAAKLVAPYDLVIDAVDSYAVKFLLSDTCVALGKPLVHAGISPFTGQLLTIVPGRTACLRCLYPGPPPSPPRDPGAPPPGGPIGPVPGVIGALQAMEAIKLLACLAPPSSSLLLYDALTPSFQSIPAPPSPSCPVCSSIPTVQPSNHQTIKPSNGHV